MRKLATAAISYSAAVLLAQYLLPVKALFWAVAGALLLFVFARIFLKGPHRLRAAIICVAAAVGFFWYGAFRFFIVLPCEAISGETVETTAVITEYPVDYGDTLSVYARLTSADGPRVAVRIYDEEKQLNNAVPGDTISMQIRLSNASVRYGEENDLYPSRGVFLIGYLNGTAEITGRTRSAFLYFPKTIAKELGQSVDRAFPADTAPLIKALCLGDRTDFYRDTELNTDMGIVGLLHVVAISGLHISLLIGLLQRILKKRRGAAGIMILFMILYAGICGGSPSILRVVFMQSCILLAPLLRRENDTATTLSTILALLLLVNPQAAGHVGLQLSFAATAGILLFSSRISAWCVGKFKKTPLQKYAPGRWLYGFISANTGTSIGAMIFTVPLTAAHFGYISMYALLGNLLCLWIIPILLVGGLCMAVLGMLLPSAALAGAAVISWPAHLFIWLVKHLAALPFAAVYTTNIFILLWIFVVYIVFGSSYFLRGGGEFRILIPGCVSVITLCAALFSTAYANDTGNGLITVLDVGQGQSICVLTEQVTAVIDCGATGTTKNAGDTALQYLHAAGRNKVDVLLLTHLHRDHANGAAKLLSGIQVDTILLPECPEDTDDLLDEILRLARAHHTEVRYLDEETTLCWGNTEFDVFPPVGDGEVNESGLTLAVHIGAFDMLVTGDISAAGEEEVLERYDLPEMEMLLVGHHGSKYSTSYALLHALTPEIAVISVGYNSYGHPTRETLKRLDAYETDVYRTDLDGNITIRLR